MARTKEEREIIANIICKQIAAYYDTLVESKKKEARQLLKDAVPVVKEMDALQKKYQEDVEKLSKKLPVGFHRHYAEEGNIRNIAKELAKYKSVKRDEIIEQLVLAGDQGAEVLVKNIVKMFT